MGILPDVAELLDLVPADFAGGEQIDWAAAEVAPGARLPGDCKALPDTYGWAISEISPFSPIPEGRARIGSV
ncbi:hypothetical protein ACGFZA_40005 [Streptomyces sp. NPDC048211]|uniref:hypothetical protein n=1 Tax=Streptomyces sp. NPDC048211 TaxID=3365516 RepID=UPI0037223509